jgi:hypothetical protein
VRILHQALKRDHSLSLENPVYIVHTKFGMQYGRRSLEVRSSRLFGVSSLAAARLPPAPPAARPVALLPPRRPAATIDCATCQFGDWAGRLPRARTAGRGQPHALFAADATRGCRVDAPLPSCDATNGSTVRLSARSVSHSRPRRCRARGAGTRAPPPAQRCSHIGRCEVWGADRVDHS